MKRLYYEKHWQYIYYRDGRAIIGGTKCKIKAHDWQKRRRFLRTFRQLSNNIGNWDGLK